MSMGRNGILTPTCHGWMEVAKEVEEQIAQEFDVPVILWDRPHGSLDPVRGILFDFIEGMEISEVDLTPEIVALLRCNLQEIHDCGIAHGDIRAQNVLSTSHGPCFLDFSSSITLPHPNFPPGLMPNFEERLQRDFRDLEIGIAILSPGGTLADMSLLHGSAIDHLLKDYPTAEARWSSRSKS
jgi:serine/threonine protein kinase